MIAYSIESTFYQLLFLALYVLIYRKRTFFGVNRVYLLCSLALSLILPVIAFPFLERTPEVFSSLQNVRRNMVYLDEVILKPDAVGSSMSWPWIIWLAGVFLSASWMLVRVFSLWSVIKRNHGRLGDGNLRIVSIRGESSAFSFFRWIFLGDRLTPEQQEYILQHEGVHAAQWHTLDILFIELLRVPFWFNPLLWSYRRLLEEVHEYQADAVAARGARDTYYLKLLGQTFGIPRFSLAHPFSKKSLIKKRIDMLHKKTSPKSELFTYLLALPMLAIMLWVSSCEDDTTLVQEPVATEATDLDPSSEYKAQLKLLLDRNQELSAEQKAALLDRISEMIEAAGNEGVSTGDSYAIQADEKQTTQKENEIGVPFAVVDQVPVFPGCEDAADPRACFNEKIQRHIMKHFNYPEEAQKQGIEGRVAVMFTIGADGNITSIRKRGPHPLLEDEVERIISRLPKMQPGRHQGKAVGVPFAIPVVFKLN